VASTTVIPSTTVSNTARVISLKKAPEQWSVSKLPLLEGQTTFIMYCFIFMNDSVIRYPFSSGFIPGEKQADELLSVCIRNRKPVTKVS
jgi:hypothetical protein